MEIIKYGCTVCSAGGCELSFKSCECMPKFCPMDRSGADWKITEGAKNTEQQVQPDTGE